MTIRHIAVKSTLDIGRASEWNDDHHFDPTDYIDRAIDLSFSAFADYFLSDQSANGGTAAYAVDSGHLFVSVASSVGAGGLGSARGKYGDFTIAGDLPMLTMSIDLATEEAQEFGFFIHADTPFTANQEGSYFRVAAGVLYAVTGSGAAETATNLGAPSQYGVYRIEFTSTQVKFFIDDLETAAATHTTHIPTNALNVKLSSFVSGGVSQIIRCDSLAIRRIRRQ